MNLIVWDVVFIVYNLNPNINRENVKRIPVINNVRAYLSTNYFYITLL